MIQPFLRRDTSRLGSNGVATVGDPNATLGTNYGVYLSDGHAAVADRITLGPGHPLLPTSVWDPSAPLEDAHLTYYTIKQTSRFTKVKHVTVDNQFGTQTMALAKPDRMMVPTAKSLTDPAAPLTQTIDHYKCYKVGGAKMKVLGVTVTDQFGSIVVDVKKPLHLCLPAIKEHEGPLVDPATALMCYKVNGLPQPVRPHVYTLNQFGADDYDFFGPRDLCVPSTVTIP